MVQKEVADMLKGRVLVGHALHNDLKVHTLPLGRECREGDLWPLCS